MTTLDTNAIIYYLDTEQSVPKVGSALADEGSVFISVITELELLSSPAISKEDRDNIRKLLETMVIVPVDSQIAHGAAALRRNYGIETPDSIIAATTLFTNTKLLTRNTKDFTDIQDLEVVAV